MSDLTWKNQKFSRQATEQDIEFCCRLLLARKPDKGDQEALGNAIASDWSLEILVRSFLSSLEFKNTTFPKILASRGRIPEEGIGNPFETAAGEEDVFYCYRLFLGRNPDPGGWETYTSAVNRGWTLGFLVKTFLTSEEFKIRGLSRPLAQARPERIEMKGGFPLYIYSNDDVIGGYIRQEKEYEPHVTRAVEARLFPGATFVDIGANVGYFTVLGARKVGAEGRVIAYEPFPPNVSLLYLNVVANDLANVSIYPLAAAEKRTAFVSYTVDGNSGLIEFSGDPEDLPSRDIVLSATLDETLAWAGHVDVIKIDVEGCEYRALEGGREVIRRDRPVIFSEFLPEALKVTSNVSGEEYLRLFLDLGYSLYLIPEEGESIACGAEIRRILEIFSAQAGDHLDLMAIPER